MKGDQVNLDNVQETNENYISMTFDYIWFIDSYRSLSSCLDGLVTLLQNNDLKILLEDFLINWNLSIKNLAYPIESFERTKENKLPDNNYEKRDFLAH